MKLNDQLREKLKEPLGIVISPDMLDRYISQNDLIATCGDITTKNVYQKGFKMKIAVIDQKTKRNEKIENIIMPEYTHISVKSDPGYISSELYNAIEHAVECKERTLIRVQGEEDLATLPLIYFLPNNSKVLYGQPNKGIVIVNVEPKIKKKVKEIMEEMVMNNGSSY